MPRSFHLQGPNTHVDEIEVRQEDYTEALHQLQIRGREKRFQDGLALMT
jgi:hypothetical protein